MGLVVGKNDANADHHTGCTEVVPEREHEYAIHEGGSILSVRSR